MSLVPHRPYSSYEFDRPFRMLEHEWPLARNDFFRSPFNHPLATRDFFAPEFLKPWENALRPWDNALRPWDNYLRPFEQMTSAMNNLALEPGTKITTDNDKFQVSVDVQHFKPEEINVKVIDGSVTIEGKHEEKMDNHGYVSRQFVRRYALPQGCLPDTVQSKLSSDGVLTVTAPKVLALPSIGEKVVPIQHYGPVRRSIKGF